MTAEDLWPLVQKLPHDEQVRLAKLVLGAAAGGSAPDVDAYRTHPPSPGELSSEDDGLGWESEGWEPPDATR